MRKDVMSFRGKIYRCIAASLFIILFSTVAAARQNQAFQSPASQSALAQKYDNLLNKARGKGAIRVIVDLNVPGYQDDAKLSRAAAGKQQAMIAVHQDRLLSSLSGRKVSNSKRFKYTPAAAMEVDEAGLAAMMSDPNVNDISEDVLAAPVLLQSVPLIGADTAWSMGYGGAGQTIAILDTGVDKTHPMFAGGKVVAEACFSTTSVPDSSTVCPNGLGSQIGSGAAVNCSSSVSGCDHGTHVAGIAAGNDTTYKGVAKDANIIAIQVFSRFDDAAVCDGAPTPCALSYSSDQILALEHVYSLRSTYSIASVNMSIGGGWYPSNCDSDTIKTSIDNLRSAKIATVIASGNDYYKDGISYPACVSSAISTGAVNDLTDTVDSYSNSASFLSLLAPGSLITSSVPGGGTAQWQGTSMAAPHVAGAWAALKQKQPTATVDGILAALQATGTAITDTNAVVKSRINIDSALNNLGVAPGIITTVAGNGTYGFSGDGGQAASAMLGYPVGVAVDSTGNVYIADYNNNRIRKVATNGVITTIAGDGTTGFFGDNGPATSAQFSYPTGVAVDSIGNVYIADRLNNRIRKVGTDGVITTVAGNGIGTYSGDGGQATAASLNNPSGVAVDSIGNVYIADNSNHRIRKVGTDGVITTVAGNGVMGYPGDGGQATAANLDFPVSVAVDSIGNIYIADTGNNRIRRVGTNGVITTVAGNGTAGFSGDGGPATSASLNYPVGVAVDSTGNIYIADHNNNRIRKVGTNGVITTVAGNGTWGFSGDNGPATSASLFGPSGVAVDSIGNIYIADQANNRIRKVQGGAASGTPMPDLVVTSVFSVPASVQAGTSQSIAATIDNIGTASSGWTYMRFYISPDANITTADTKLTTSASVVNGINPGPFSFQLVDANVTIPSLAPGTYYIGAIADVTNKVAEVSETNNTASIAVTVTSGADLTVLSVSAPASVQAGTSQSIAATIDNIGTASSGWTYMRFYISPDANITTADTKLTTSASVVNGINPGPFSFQLVDANVTIPSLAPGIYYIGAIADVTNKVAEMNEGNNANSIAITVTSGVDLTVSSVSAPASIQAGTSTGVSATITNGGTASAALTYMRLYISPDANITTADTKLTATSLVVSGLGAGASQVINANVTIPSLAPGTYYIGAISDVTGKVAEMNEGNNANSTAITVTSGVDLTVTLVTAPASAAAGSSQSISATIANGGTASAAFTYMRFYISPDANITTADTKLTATSLVVNGLAVGASQVINANVTIPSGTASGPWYIGAIADVSGKVPEINEGNNTGSFAVSITP